MSPPKLIAHTALFAVNPVIEVVLYIKHPLAVKEAEDPQLVSANYTHAVSPDKTGSALADNVFPPAE